jgi:hypothetical protein
MWESSAQRKGNITDHSAVSLCGILTLKYHIYMFINSFKMFSNVTENFSPVLPSHRPGFCDAIKPLLPDIPL